MSPQRFKTIQQTLKRRQPDLQIFMDDVHKPHNIAAVLRSADAVGVSQMHAWTSEGRLRMPKLTAGGSNQWVKLSFHPDRAIFLKQAKQQGYQIVVAHLSDTAVDFDQIDYCKPTIICLGSEKHGASEVVAEIADQHIIIPMVGMVESLNVSVAASVILFEAKRQRVLAKKYDQLQLEHAEYERLLFEWSQPVVTRYCKKNDLPYPKLDEEGDIIAGNLTGNHDAGGYKNSNTKPPVKR